VVEMISGIVIPVCIAIFGAAGWASDRSSKHIDRRFSEIVELVSKNEDQIERIERELRNLEVNLPQKFVMREEFLHRMSDGAKKMDYLVEQVDAIKNMLMFGQNKH
jgi:hypothetical protein